MSDWRKPTETLKKVTCLPKNKGNKVIKIDLFPAMMFKDKCSPGSKWMVFPLIKITSDLRDLYRIKLNGRWHGRAGYQYYFLTKNEAWEIFKNA